jgi:hypothetical protein
MEYSRKKLPDGELEMRQECFDILSKEKHYDEPYYLVNFDAIRGNSTDTKANDNITEILESKPEIRLNTQKIQLKITLKNK